MKILQVVEPGRDGVFRHVEDLVHYLVRHDHAVSLAYSDRRSCDRLPVLLDFVIRHGGKVLNLDVSNAPALGDLRALLQLSRFAREGHFDIIHAHSSKAGGLVRLLAWQHRSAKYFYTPNAYFAMEGRPGLAPAFLNFVERFLAPAAITVNVSEDEAIFARNVLKVSPNRQVVIPNPVDTEHFQPGSPEQKCAVRARLGIPENAVVVGAIGRFSYQKNPEMLYRAFAIAAAENPNLVLFHVGDGDLQGAVKEICQASRISDKVFQTSYLPNPTQFYEAVDMLVMTSRFEGLSYAVLEALSFNLPLVLTDVPGNRDFLRAGLSHAGKCATGDSAGCARAILEMSTRLGQSEPVNHRAVTLKTFSLEVCFSRLTAEYFRPSTDTL